VSWCELTLLANRVSSLRSCSLLMLCWQRLHIAALSPLHTIRQFQQLCHSSRRRVNVAASGCLRAATNRDSAASDLQLPGMDRKKRKWDVSAPAGGAVPSTAAVAGRAGIGSSGSGLPAQYAGFVTGQGLLKEPTPAPAPIIPRSTYKPGDPLDAATISRAQAGAAAAMEKINKVRASHAVSCSEAISQHCHQYIYTLVMRTMGCTSA